MTKILISIFLLAIMLVGGNAQNECSEACYDAYVECCTLRPSCYDIYVDCLAVCYRDCLAVSTLADQKLYLRRRKN